MNIQLKLDNACIGVRGLENNHLAMDSYGKANNMTVTFAAWHPNPEYRMFETGKLLSSNERYPIGLIVVDECGEPTTWKFNNV
jgi:hypothetical protein